jgi:hypothetical protein
MTEIGCSWVFVQNVELFDSESTIRILRTTNQQN